MDNELKNQYISTGETVWREYTGQLVKTERYAWRNSKGKVVATSNRNGDVLTIVDGKDSHDIESFDRSKYRLTQFGPLCSHLAPGLFDFIAREHQGRQGFTWRSVDVYIESQEKPVGYIAGLGGVFCPSCHTWYIDELQNFMVLFAKRGLQGSAYDTVDEANVKDEEAWVDGDELLRRVNEETLATNVGQLALAHLQPLAINPEMLTQVLEMNLAEDSGSPEIRTGEVFVTSFKQDPNCLQRPNAFYIGRACISNGHSLEDSILRNPYKMDKATPQDGNRERVIHLQKSTILNQAIRYDSQDIVRGISLPEVKKTLIELRDLLLLGQDIYLICHCKLPGGKTQPRCHGDETANCLNWMVQQEVQRRSNLTNSPIASSISPNEPFRIDSSISKRSAKTAPVQRIAG